MNDVKNKHAPEVPKSLYWRIALDFKKGHARRSAICMTPDFLLKHLAKKAVPKERIAFTEHINEKCQRYIQALYTIAVKLKNPILEYITVLKEDIAKSNKQISDPVPTTNRTIRQRRLSENEKTQRRLEELSRRLANAEENLASVERTYDALKEEALAIKNNIVKAYLQGGTP